MHNFINSFSDYEFDNYGLVRLPTISISNEQKKLVNLSNNSSNFDYLKSLVDKNFKEHCFSQEKHIEYWKRINYELSIFDELGFIDYVLLVYLVINKARELGVFIDYGRGSCAGSMVFFILNITGVNAIEKGLLFERFVSRVRSKKQIIDGNVYLQGDLIADADLNLGEGREEIVEWLKTLYPNRISKILNISTFTGKILIKDVYKIYEEASEDEANSLSDLIEKRFGIVEEITECYKNNEDFKKWADENKDCYIISQKLSSLIRQESCHASGYVISYDNLNNLIPLELNKDGELMSGYDMREISNFAIKLDLLSLTTNRIIKEILNNTNEDISRINLDDEPIIYNQFQNNKLLPFGLYQISAHCAYGVTNEIKPKNIFELSDVNACARPGALSYVKSYVLNNHPCPHPLFEKILKPTRNHCLYQEQMMQLLVAVGFTLDDAEQCRKIVGKKLVDKVKEWKDKIYKKVKENNLPENLGDILWKVLEDSSKYSFNLSHSLATSYLSALTVYLKYKQPLDFYCACLNSIKDLTKPEESVQDNIAIVKHELDNFSIKLLPPDLVKSQNNFVKEYGDIRFGFKSVKGISEKNLERIEKFKNQSYKNKFELFESLKNSEINIGIGSALIQAGCLESYGTRSRVVLELQTWNILTPREKILCLSLGEKVKWDVLDCIVYLKSTLNENGKLYIKESRFNTIKNKYDKYKQIYVLNSKNETLANYFYEKIILGYCYSNSISSIYSHKIDNLLTIDKASKYSPNSQIKCIGFVKNPRKGKTKAKNDYLSFQLSDETGNIKVMLFNQKIEYCEEMNERLPIDDDLAIIEGQLREGNCIFANRIGIQTKSIYMKLSELKDD